jgi:hypothetical protein
MWEQISSAAITLLRCSATLKRDEQRGRRRVKQRHIQRSQAMSIALLQSVIDRAALGIARRPLTEDDAIDIWIARWLRTPRKQLLARYACDPRRLYEIWEGARFPASRGKALEKLRATYPQLIERIDPGTHRRVPRCPHPDQLSMFD